MKHYRVEFINRAKRELKKLDKHISLLIIGWIEKNLEGCTDPRKLGKGLVGSRSGEWRYRVGDYRIISKIEEEKIVILILDVGHRKLIYKKY